MRTRLMLLLLAVAVRGFSYYVERYNGAGLCATNDRQFERKEVFPIVDLEKSEMPRDNEGKRWVDDWQQENFEVGKFNSYSLRQNYRTRVTGGSHELMKIQSDDYLRLFVLVDELTFVLTEKDAWRGAEAFRVHLDQVDPDDQTRRMSTVEFCTQLGTSRENCTELTKKVGDPILLAGKRWVNLNMDEIGARWALERDGEEVLVWRRSSSIMDTLNVFVETHGKPGIFKIPLATELEPQGGKNRLWRTFDGGVRCLRIWWLAGVAASGSFSVASNGSEVQRGVLSVSAGSSRLEVRPAAAKSKIQLELFNVTGRVAHLGPCPGSKMEIFSPASGCSLFEQGPRFSPRAAGTLHRARLDATLSVELSEGNLKRVCSALGFRIGDSQEKVKFCSKSGCVFGSCPPHALPGGGKPQKPSHRLK